MRLSLFLPFFASTGCVSSWSLDMELQEGCGQRAFFLDDDGDGWGDPDSEPVFRCEGDDATGFTSRNARDCDDGDVHTTGQVGSICPERLVTAATDYVGVIYGDSEYAVVVDDMVSPEETELRWPQFGADACSARGWGGALARFETADELNQITAAISATMYAGWVGAVPNAAGGWSWEGSEEEISNSVIPYCSLLTADSSWVDEDARLAIVKTENGSWCLGYPDEMSDSASGAGFGLPEYDFQSAHFVCERATPDPLAYETDAEPISSP